MSAAAYSVVIPAWNAAATLAAAVESVLAQVPAPAAVIVVDDGSTDATAEVAAGFGGRVACLHQANAGPGAATMRGLSAVTTRFAATLDADDLWLPGKAARQLAWLEGDGAVDACFTLLRQFSDDPADARAGVVAKGWSRTTMMLRTGLVATVGAMRDPPGRRGELVDWLARAREAGARLDMIDEVLALRRLRPGSLSDGRGGPGDRGYLHVVRDALARRRAAGRPG